MVLCVVLNAETQEEAIDGKRLETCFRVWLCPCCDTQLGSNMLFSIKYIAFSNVKCMYNTLDHMYNTLDHMYNTLDHMQIHCIKYQLHRI